MGLAKQLRHFRQNSYRSHYEFTAVQYELNGVSTVGLFETRKTPKIRLMEINLKY